MNAQQWQTECAYIARVTDGIARDGIVPADFNGELAVFVRYCEMQRDAATRDGRDDSAQYIQHCIDDTKNQCENKRAPALCGGGMACGEAFNCCDCYGNGCGCRYCFSCNACDACRED